MAQGLGEPSAVGERKGSSNAGREANSLVIWGDDIGITSLSCYSWGLMGYRTPNIDRIADITDHTDKMLHQALGGR